MPRLPREAREDFRLEGAVAEAVALVGVVADVLDEARGEEGDGDDLDEVELPVDVDDGVLPGQALGRRRGDLPEVGRRLRRERGEVGRREGVGRRVVAREHEARLAAEVPDVVLPEPRGVADDARRVRHDAARALGRRVRREALVVVTAVGQVLVEFLFDAAAAAAATPGDAHPAAAQIVGIADQILPQIYGTAEARDGLALGALADCAGYAAVAGSIKGSQCEVHAAACARVLGLDGAPWLADLLSGMFVKKRDW